MIASTARIVQLSAVAPNIKELTDWISIEENAQSVMLDWRTSRLRIGVLERTKHGSAILDFGEKPFTLLQNGALPIHPRAGLAALANHLSKTGIVLVLCPSPAAAKEVAELVAELRSQTQDVTDDISKRLDAWIERELYPESLSHNSLQTSCGSPVRKAPDPGRACQRLGRKLGVTVVRQS